MPRELDEDDVRVRPPRSTRPRTKSRPGHLDAAPGIVVTVDRGRYRVRVDGVIVTAVRARELGRRAVVVGDRVGVVGDLSGGPDALARVVRVEERTSVLRRTPDDTDPLERAVVANAEVLVVVTALADPVPRPRLIDRCLVAAFDGGLVPLLCLTKSDLASPSELLALYEPLGVEAVVTGHGSGVAELLRWFDVCEAEAKKLIDAGLPLPAYEQITKASHTFNLLDARRAISVTERQRYILRVRSLSLSVAEAYYEQMPSTFWALPPPAEKDQGSTRLAIGAF